MDPSRHTGIRSVAIAAEHPNPLEGKTEDELQEMARNALLELTRYEGQRGEFDGLINARRELLEDIIKVQKERTGDKTIRIFGRKVTLADGRKGKDKWFADKVKVMLKKKDELADDDTDYVKQVFRQRIYVELEDPDIAQLIVDFLKDCKVSHPTLTATHEEFFDEGALKNLIDRGIIEPEEIDGCYEAGKVGDPSLRIDSAPDGWVETVMETEEI